MLPVTIAAGETTYATRRRPREWRILLFQILEAAKLPNAKPLSGDQNTLITYQAVDRYARDGSLWFGLKAVTYNSADVFPPEPLLTAKVPSEFAAIVAENSLSEQLNHATSAEHGSDLDSVSECGTMPRKCDSILGGYANADEPMLEPSGQAPQTALEPVPQTPRRRWGFRGWIKSVKNRLITICIQAI